MLASNYAQVQTSGGHPPSTTTLQEKKLRWIEKQMKKKKEQTMRVSNKISRDDVYKVLIFMTIEQ
jgi:F0F1-type ATP synthase delta subunit